MCVVHICGFIFVCTGIGRHVMCTLYIICILIFAEDIRPCTVLHMQLCRYIFVNLYKLLHFVFSSIGSDFTPGRTEGLVLHISGASLLG